MFALPQRPDAMSAKYVRVRRVASRHETPPSTLILKVSRLTVTLEHPVTLPAPDAEADGTLARTTITHSTAIPTRLTCTKAPSESLSPRTISELTGSRKARKRVLGAFRAAHQKGVSPRR